MKDLKEKIRKFLNEVGYIGYSPKVIQTQAMKKVGSYYWFDFEKLLISLSALFDKEIAELKEDAAHKEMDWFCEHRKVEALELQLSELTKQAKIDNDAIEGYLLALQHQGDSLNGIIKRLELQLAKAKDTLSCIENAKPLQTQGALIVYMRNIAKSTLTEIGV